MKIKNIIYSVVASGAILASGAPAAAQSLEILGITNDGVRGQLKAKANLGGKTPTGVTTYSYNMTDGYTVANTAYEFVTDGTETYLTADVYWYDGTAYAYRAVVTFSDGTTYTSPVVTEDLKESFMWLSDYKYAEGVSGWDTNHPPVNDKEVDPTLTMTLDGVRYYKGVSNHAPGYIIYKFPQAQFLSFYTKYGVTDQCSEGDVFFTFYTGTDENTTTPSALTPRGSDTMYAKSNPKRPANAPAVKEITFDMTGAKVLRFDFGISDGENYGDHANLAMARMNLPVSEVIKSEQNVTFATPPSDLSAPLTLDASASSGNKVFYRIISGREFATIQNGNVLTPTWGGKGTVIVEATQYGDDTHYPASAYQTFYVDMKPTMTLLDIYHPSVANTTNSSYVYLYIDTKGKKLDKLDVNVYKDVNTLTPLSTKSILDTYDSSKSEQIVEIEVPQFGTQVLQISYSYADDAQTVTMPYWHSEGSFDYISDMPTTNYRMTAGWGNPSQPNKAFNGDNGGILKIVANQVVYAKGLGTHARGTLEIQPEYLGPYNRVAADMGAQAGYGGNTDQTMAYTIESGNMVIKTSKTYDEATGQYVGGDVKKGDYVSWDVPFNNGSILRFIIDKGTDNKDDNDHVCIGAPRLYYTPTGKAPQYLWWETEQTVLSNKAAEIELTAETSTGYAPYYRIVEGSEYARIDNGHLVIDRIPVDGGRIVVDAFHPGDNIYGITNIATCTFSLVHGLEVQKYEYVELKESDTLDRLIIHADKESSGQVNVKNGLVNVKTLELKYTFTPGEWVYISFPSDLDIEKVSDFKDQGYVYNAYYGPAYFIREIDPNVGVSNLSGVDGWRDLETPNVKGLKGYIMSINNALTDEPVEVTFTIDNSGLDLANLMRSLGLTLDLTNMEPGKTQKITVKAANPDVVSEDLTIEVTFNPADYSKLPLNHEKALERMRFTFVNGHKAIRLTLPDQTPARVVFFDQSGKKMLKAVKYIAPNVIDLRDFKPGQYNMVVGYGPATKTYEITL